jgi:hypothetical protein
MNDLRPYASLSSGLLARKGAAKPAMRPQSYTTFEDLGWNDMGEEAPVGIEQPEHVPSSIAALTPAPFVGGSEPIADFEPDAAFEEEVEAEPEAIDTASPVAAQHEAIRSSLAIDSSEAEPERRAKPRRPRAKAQVVALPRRSKAPAGRRSAFTLRLDAERHLKLRLACAVAGRSAQQLVTDALDRALGEIPEVEALAARAAGANRN